MRFAFTDDQLAFRDAVRDLLAKECPPSVVRDAWERDGHAGGAWTALGEMGVLGVMADEATGGLGLGMLDLVLLLEETGWAALPEPIVEHAAVAIPMLADPGAALDGSQTITAPVHYDQVHHDQVHHDQVHHDQVHHDQVHHDQVMPYTDRADGFLVFDGDAVRLAARADVSLEACPSVDGARHLARVSLTGDAPVVGEGHAASRAFDRGALGTAAQLVGLTRRMIDMTVEYVVERKQFGVPIGSFQAVKHHLADARLGLEFARPLVYRAAWSVDAGDAEAPVHVSMAKALASDAATLAGRQALQCHGAMGYSYEYDLHLFLKRGWVLAAAWGDADWHRDRVGRAIL